jgi:hypothetical protein
MDSHSEGPNDSIAGAVVDQWHPDIPSSVLPAARELFSECLAMNPEGRPSFRDILDRLEQMQFKVIERVNSKKVAAFVESTRNMESANDTPRNGCADAMRGRAG